MNAFLEHLPSWVLVKATWLGFAVSLVTTKEWLQIVALILAIIASTTAILAHWSTLRKNNRKP